MGQNLGYWSFYLLNLDFSNVLYKNLFVGAGADRSRAFKGGAGAEIFKPGAVAEKTYLEPA